MNAINHIISFFILVFIHVTQVQASDDYYQSDVTRKKDGVKSNCSTISVPYYSGWARCTTASGCDFSQYISQQSSHTATLRGLCNGSIESCTDILPFGGYTNIQDCDYTPHIIARYRVFVPGQQINSKVRFDAHRSYDQDGGSIAAYRWYINGSLVNSSSAFEYTVSYVPTYVTLPVKLVVTDDEGQNNTIEFNVSINNGDWNCGEFC